jgi:hypothetical protein
VFLRKTLRQLWVLGYVTSNHYRSLSDCFMTLPSRSLQYSRRQVLAQAVSKRKTINVGGNNKPIIALIALLSGGYH